MKLRLLCDLGSLYEYESVKNFMIKKQQEKSQQTKAELMKSAIKLFGEKGFVTTTISDITNDAGYAKGNFYRYWKSKDEIFLNIMENRFAKYRSERKNFLNKAKDIEQVLDIIWNFLETIIDDEKWSKIFIEFTVHASRDKKLKQKLNTHPFRLSSDLFAEIFQPYAPPGFSYKKIGALVTALFEGYLIQTLLETNIINKQDLKNAILTLIKNQNIISP